MATIINTSTQYNFSGRGPLDSKSLVKTYADLLNPATWASESGTTTAYNGMITAVWLNTEDSSKNGIYYLHDATVTSTRKSPDVTLESNWHKISGLDDATAKNITALILATEKNTEKLAGIETTVTDYVASVVNAITMPKASAEITMAEDGTLGIGEVSTDKLVQGFKTLVLSGGTASN